MCGRYAMAIDPNELAGRFNDLGLPVNETNTGQLHNKNHISYNIAPTQDAPVYVQSNEATRIIRYMHWGVNSVKGKETFNAQWERVVSDKPSRLWNMMRGKHRCAVPMMGYYEWHTDKSKKKTPYYITRKDSKLVFLAGLYSIADDDVFKFTVITGPAPDKMKWLHHRMPIVIVPGTADFDEWMNTSTGWSERVGQSLKVFEGYDELEIYEVGSSVGNVKNKGKELISKKSEKMGIGEMVGRSQGKPKSEEVKDEKVEDEKVKNETVKNENVKKDERVKEEIKSNENSKDDIQSGKVKEETKDELIDNQDDEIKSEDKPQLSTAEKRNQTKDSILTRAEPPHKKRKN